MPDRHVDIPPLSPILVEPAVRAALAEDLGRGGDLATDTVIDAGARMRAALNARQKGVLSGLAIAETAFRLIDPSVVVTRRFADGDGLVPGDTIAEIEGPARAILTAERVALNYLGHLSGIATETR